MKAKWVVVFLFVLSSVCSQTEEDTLLVNEIEIICQGKLQNFHKAHNFYLENNFDSAYLYSRKAIELKENNSDIKDYINLILGTSASLKGFDSIAIKYFQKIPESFKFNYIKDHEVAKIKYEQEEFKTALNLFHRVLLSEKIKSNQSFIDIYHGIGLSNLFLKEFKKSEEYLNKGLVLAEQEKDTADIIHTKMDLGSLFYEQYQDDKAIPLFIEAYELATKQSDFNLKALTSRNMAVIEKNRKNFEKSVEYYEKHRQYQDSIWNRDKISLLLEKEKEHAVGIKQNEINLKNERIKTQRTQRNWLLSFIGVAVLFLGVLGYFYRDKVKKNQIITSQNQKLDNLNNVKDYLLAVVSHDLRSPVKQLQQNSLSLEKNIESKDWNQAKTLSENNKNILHGTSHFLNNVLNWALEQSDQLNFTPDEIPIKPIVEQVIYDYKEFYETKEVKIETELNNVIAFVDREQLKTVLRNLLDNALKYSSIGENIKVELGTYNETLCYLSVQDFGTGMPKEILNKIKNLNIEKVDRIEGIGLGFVLINRLIQRNKGEFEIESQPNQGTKVTIRLPMV